MRTTLATTTLAMPADQSLLVKDVYDIDGSQNNTSVIDVLKDVSGDIAKVIRNDPNLAQKVVMLGTDARSGRLTQQTTLNRVTSLLGGSNGILSDLSGSLATGLSNTFGMDPMLTNKVLTVVMDSVTGQPSYSYGQYGSYGNMSSASEVTRVIQRVLGNRDVFEQIDMGAEAAMLGELINQAVRAGIPSAVDILLRNASNNDNRRYIVTRNLTPILFSGDLATMEQAITYVAPSSIASLRPNFAREFLANFKLPFATTRGEYLSIKNRILALLSTINPNWPYRPRGSQLMLSLEPFTLMSKDAKEVFTMSDSFRTASIIASKFNAQALASLIRAQYPYFPI